MHVDERGARHGVPVVARDGQLSALVPLDLLAEHVEVGQVVGGRYERSAALTALVRRAYGALERRRAVAAGR